jgi:hypothetical protein
MNSVTYIAKERTRITENSCHVITTHRSVTPRTRRTQPPLLLRVYNTVAGNALIKSVTILKRFFVGKT